MMNPRIPALAILIAALVLSGCVGGASTPAVEPSAGNPPAEIESIPKSEPEAENIFMFDEMGFAVGFSFPDGIEQAVSTSVVGVHEAALPFELPYPAHARILFTAYSGGLEDIPAAGLRVFRADEINALEAGVLDSLNAVLEGQVDHHTDFPRLAGAGSIIDAQLKPLAFQNGNGYRYLLTKSFSADPLTSTGMTYMYQGLTRDEKYFVSFIVNVDAPFLAEFVGQPLTTGEEFEVYYQDINARIEAASGDQFAPQLTALDELVSSIIVLER